MQIAKIIWNVQTSKKRHKSGTKEQKEDVERGNK